VDCEVFINDTTVCSNSIAVLTCTTNTGFLRWTTLGGVNADYNSPTVGVILDLDGQYTLNLTSVTNGNIFTSTATTNNPVSSDQSLTCFDALFGGFSETANIQVESISSPFNIERENINDTAVKISWNQTDVRGCVTGFYINIASASQIIPINSGETSAIIPVTPDTDYTFTVIATDGWTNRSTDGPPFNTFNLTPPKFVLPPNISSTVMKYSWSPVNHVIRYYFIHVSNGTSKTILIAPEETSVTIPVTANTSNTFTIIATNGLMNTSDKSQFNLFALQIEAVPIISDRDNIRTLTWEFPPNLPPVFNQSIIFNGVVEVIGANDRNWIFDFKENSNYTIDLLATNVIGTNSIRLFSYRQLIIIPVIYYSIGMFVLLGISVILIIILIVVTSYLVYNKYKQKKSSKLMYYLSHLNKLEVN
jgi:hypothetical protein